MMPTPYFTGAPLMSNPGMPGNGYGNFGNQFATASPMGFSQPSVPSSNAFSVGFAANPYGGAPVRGPGIESF